MLSANLYLLSKTEFQLGINQVVIGVSISENDASLPSQYVSGIVNWGDGSSYSISPVQYQIQIPSTVDISYSSNSVYLNLTPTPNSGIFSLVYNSILIPNIPYNISTPQLQQLLTTAVGNLGTVVVNGSFPQWNLNFLSPDLARLLTFGTDSLFAPLPLPTHNYPNGNFNINLLAQNYRAPLNDTLTSSLRLSFLPSVIPPPAAPTLIGPILPADAGFPNKNQWDFNISTDIKVLASNVKMILLVEPGERLMLPTYGCPLRRLIFDPIGNSTSQEINTAIQNSITAWEPRVSIQSLSSSVDENNRIITIQMILQSKLQNQAFSLTASVSR